MTKKLVVVLGMHRSGSSAITRGLKVLGVGLGHSFIPNYDDNIKGFWEDADFQAINVEMLSALGYDWHSLDVFTDGNLLARLSSFRLRALDLLRQKISSTSVLGVKDPRFSRLMPFWKELFDSEKIEVGYVIPLRNPISVALSLKKRNGFEFEKSFFLWQQHMLLSILDTEPESSVIVDFDLMLANPEEQLLRISQKLGLNSPAKEALQEYSDEYLDNSLRHAEYTFDDLQSESAVPVGVRELFRVLFLLAEDKKTIKNNDVHDSLIEQLHNLKQSNPLLQLIDRSDRAVQAKEQQYDNLEKKFTRCVDDIKKQSDAISQLRETVDRQRAAIETYKEQISEQTSNHKRIISEHQQVIEKQKSNLAEQKEQYQKIFNEQKEQHQRAVDEQKEQHQRAVDEQKEQHQRAVDEQKEQHQRAVNEQKEQYQKNVDEQKEQYQKNVDEKNEHFSQVTTEYKEYKIQQESKLADQKSVTSDQQRLLTLRQREIDRLRGDTQKLSGDIKQRAVKIGEQEKKLRIISSQLQAVESKYNKFIFTPEWKIGSKLRHLVSSGGKSLKLLKQQRSRKSLRASDLTLKMIENSGVFNEKWYRKGFSSEEQPGHPLQHYLSSGWKEGRTPSILFDGNWYLDYYPDVKAAGICPLQHYLEQGWKENRQPHSAFDGNWYLKFYSDVRAAKVPPLQHYILFGAREGRRPNRIFDVKWFVSKYAEKIDSLVSDGVLVSYLRAANQGEGQVFEHSPLFRANDYAAKNPQFDPHNESALAHLLPRIRTYIQNIALQSACNEGILKSFDQKAATTFCLSVRRQEFNGDNSVNTPLVSIVMPTHNRRHKICAAIDSVLQQSYDNWELLIVDDGSEDQTYQLVQDNYVDSRIKIQRTEAYGVCHARNAALAIAQGELVSYLDSDNTWVKDFLELMVAYLQQSSADFVYSAIRMENESGTNYRYREFNHDDLLIKNFIDLNAILHKRQLYDQLGGFDETLFRMVDWDLVIRYTKSASIASAPFIGVNYDNHKQPDRITVKEPKSWRYAIMNKHLIDWDAVVSELHLRDKELVSVIIPVYGQLELTRKCIESLLQVPAGRAFEIILVDNGSSYDVLEELFAWSEGLSEVILVRNLENLNFALGCNLGFMHSRGAQVVFLNNDTEVTSGWLNSLLNPLQGKVGAVQPKLLYPDGRVQCAGIVFSEYSSIGFPIYADFPANLPVVNRSRQYQAITAACMAVGSADFARLKGFDPLYVNGQEDVDFCFRLAELGKVCWYESGSVVVHHESRTPGRGQFIAQNRVLFDERWSEKIVPDVEKYLRADGYRVRGWRTDGHEIKGYQPVLSKLITNNDTFGTLTFAIKVPCPKADVKDEWGDYHFARSLGAALHRAGYSFRIDFLNEWDNGFDTKNEVNLVLRGLSAFEPRSDQINLMWMISHPDKITTDELDKYDYIFVASSAYTNELRQKLGEKVSCLFQCTDPSLFYPDEKKTEFNSEILFVGNSRNQYRDVVKLAIEEECELSVYGTRWQQFIDAKYIKGENIPNNELSHYYRNTSVVLNDHWQDMKSKGFVSNRIFDVLACGQPILSDRVRNFPSDLEEFVYFFDKENSVSDAIEKIKEETLVRKQERFDFAMKIHQRHSFDARVETLLKKLSELL